MAVAIRTTKQVKAPEGACSFLFVLAAVAAGANDLEGDWAPHDDLVIPYSQVQFSRVKVSAFGIAFPENFSLIFQENVSGNTLVVPLVSGATSADVAVNWGAVGTAVLSCSMASVGAHAGLGIQAQLIGKAWGPVA